MRAVVSREEVQDANRPQLGLVREAEPSDVEIAVTLTYAYAICGSTWRGGLDSEGVCDAPRLSPKPAPFRCVNERGVSP